MHMTAGSERAMPLETVVTFPLLLSCPHLEASPSTVQDRPAAQHSNTANFNYHSHDNSARNISPYHSRMAAQNIYFLSRLRSEQIINEGTGSSNTNDATDLDPSALRAICDRSTKTDCPCSLSHLPDDPLQ